MIDECISNLEQQIQWIEEIDAHKFPGWGHAVGAMRQAVALLKTQEPVDVDEWPDAFLCPTCKTRLAGRSNDDCVLLDTNDTPNFCWVCGQAVKWE